MQLQRLLNSDISSRLNTCYLTYLIIFVEGPLNKYLKSILLKLFSLLAVIYWYIIAIINTIFLRHHLVFFNIRCYKKSHVNLKMFLKRRKRSLILKNWMCCKMRKLFSNHLYIYFIATWLNAESISLVSCSSTKLAYCVHLGQQ